MQGIYTYIPETNYVPREYSVAGILLLLFKVLISLVPVLNLLYSYISTFRSMCAVPNMAVFCSSLTPCFPGMLLMNFLNDFEIVPVAPIITGIAGIIIIIIIITIIIKFLTSQLWLGNIHLSWDVVINRIRLCGLICSLKSFLQLNMCQELQIFAVVYMYSHAS